jgi:hypothetical protein
MTKHLCQLMAENDSLWLQGTIHGAKRSGVALVRHAGQASHGR